MMASTVCRVCSEDIGSVEASTNDGYFYCALCQTRCSGIHEIKQQDYQYGLRKPKPVRVKKSPQKCVDYGQAWTSIEGFNIILHAQVKALISLGASPRLKDAVLELWTKYLRLSGIAFMDPESSQWVPPFSSFVARNRDIQVAWMGKKSISLRRMAAIPEKNDRPKKANSTEKSAEDGLLFDPDTPTCSLQIAYLERLVEQNDEVDESVHKSIERLQKMENKRRRSLSACAMRSPEYMTMSKTICFCYLGLLMLQEQILLADIIRWIKEGRFPYMDASHHFLKSMKLQNQDFRIFSPKQIPTLGTLYMDIGKFVRFLDLPSLPTVQLEPVVSRFIMQLHLPAELCGVVNNLMEVKRPTMKYDKKNSLCIRYPSLEIRALAFIMVALKILFSLDDSTEKWCSLLARKLNSNNLDENVFVWDDWVEHMNMRGAFLKAFHVPSALKNITDVVATDNLSSFYLHTMVKWHPPETVTRKRKVFGYMPSTIDGPLIPVIPKTFTPLTGAKSANYNSPTSTFSESVNLKFYSERVSATDFQRHDFSYDSLLTLFDEDNLFEFPDHLASKYWYLHSNKSHLKDHTLENLPVSFLWLLDLCCEAASSLKRVELYEEIISVEKIVLKCGWGQMKKQKQIRLEKEVW